MTTPNDPAAPLWTPTTQAAEPEPETETEPETTAPPSRAAGPRRSGATTALLLIGALVAVGGIGFATGRATSTGQTGTGSNTALNANGIPGFGPGGSFDPANFAGGQGADRALGAQSISGTVISVTADSVKVQLASGETMTIATTSTTTYHGQTSASSADVATGDTVTVKTTGGAGQGAAASAATTYGHCHRRDRHFKVTRVLWARAVWMGRSRPHQWQARPIGDGSRPPSRAARTDGTAPRSLE